jgi:predicted O-methyltransferase YrrM
MAMKDPAFVSVLAEYNARLAEESKIIRDPATSITDLDLDKYLIPVGEDVGRLMHTMVIGLDARVIVELGTSYGYSTLFLADAARATGGHVYSYDLAPEKQAYARERLERAGLSKQVDFRSGDAIELLASQPEPVDFVLLDIWKDLYVPCLERIVPLLRAGGTILADNMIFPPDSRADAAAYRVAVRAVPEIQAVLLPIGNGIDIAIKQGFD